MEGILLFEASSLDEAIRFDEGSDMRFRLMAGSYGVGTVVIGLDGSTQEVLSTTATLPQFPDHNFVYVKWTSSNGTDYDYEYFHESAGLVLDIWDDSGDTSGDGWILEGFPTTPIIGDFCGANFGPPDGYVDVWDLMQFAEHWHTDTGDSNWDSKFDLAGPSFGASDGYIDVWDLMVFADHWHEGEKP